MSNPKGYASTLKPYKSQWKSGQTQTIRVPIALADRLLSIARRLDNNESITELNLQEMAATLLADPAITRNGRDKGAVRRALDTFLAAVKHQTEKTAL